MLIVIVVSIALIGVTTTIHYEVLRYLSALLCRLTIRNRTKVLVVMFATFVAHAAEISVYGLTLFMVVSYMGAGWLNGTGTVSLLDTFYFSAETYTSLGFGDLTPSGPVRLLAGVEALNGLLLIGWSASFIYLAMERFWNNGNNGDDFR